MHEKRKESKKMGEKEQQLRESLELEEARLEVKRNEKNKHRDALKAKERILHQLREKEMKAR